MHRNDFFKLRLPTEQKSRWQRHAAGLDLTLAEYVRGAVERCIEEDRREAGNRHMARQVTEDALSHD